MDEKLKALILSLCDKVDEVIQNNDWPTTEGHWHDDGVTCSCPINEMLTEIREGLGGV